MNSKHLPQLNSPGGSAPAVAREELPLTVRDAAVYLGVSVQTVYLWVERKRIPHLRVMGRNIRFLKADLEPFRSTFKQAAVDFNNSRVFGMTHAAPGSRSLEQEES
jgi:excisionase family DNA binding protein